MMPRDKALTAINRDGLERLRLALQRINEACWEYEMAMQRLESSIQSSQGRCLPTWGGQVTSDSHAALEAREALFRNQEEFDEFLLAMRSEHSC